MHLPAHAGGCGTYARPSSRWSGMSSRIGNATSGNDNVAGPVSRSSRRRIGRIVVASLGAGLAAAVVLPFVPAATVDENFSTGMVLLGFALGRAFSAGPYTRLTHQPQRRAVVP